MLNADIICVKTGEKPGSTRGQMKFHPAGISRNAVARAKLAAIEGKLPLAEMAKREKGRAAIMCRALISSVNAGDKEERQRARARGKTERGKRSIAVLFQRL